MGLASFGCELYVAFPDTVSVLISEVCSSLRVVLVDVVIVVDVDAVARCHQIDRSIVPNVESVCHIMQCLYCDTSMS